MLYYAATPWPPFKLASHSRAPTSSPETGLQQEKPSLLGAEGELMDDGRLQGAAADAGRARSALGCRLLAEGSGRIARGRLLPGRTWYLALPDLRAGTSSSPSAASRSHRLYSAASACPIRSLSFLALPFALPWSHLFTLPSLLVTHRSPSTVTHFVPSLLTLHLSRGRLLRGLSREMLRTPRPGSAPWRTLCPPLPPPQGRSRQVSAPSFPQ